MITFGLVFGLFLLVVAMMSVGVMAKRKPITGSCGGIQNLGMNATCDFCGGDPDKCENRSQSAETDATTQVDELPAPEQVDPA